MVGRTPPKQSIMLSLNPVLIRETLNKVDQCMVRLQELQYTVAGGTKVDSGVSLSPRSTKGYLRTSVRCKQESVRVKHDAERRSPAGKIPKPTNSEEGEEWRQMSLSAMLVGETVGQILHASQFARKIVSTVSRKNATKDPKTPLSQLSKQKLDPENTKFNDRRRKEKQINSVSDTPPPQRARSRINFKVSPPKGREFDKENSKCFSNKVSSKNRPCGSNNSKTVLVTNPLFLSTHFSRQQHFCKTKSPVISRSIGTQHKCSIKSPPKEASQFQVKIKNPSTVSISSSSTRTTTTSLSLSKKSSPKRWAPPFSPSRVAARLLASSKLKSKKTEQKNDRLLASSKLKSTKTEQKNDGVGNLRKSSSKRSLTSKLTRTFSPSRLVKKFVSPLKSEKNVQQRNGLVNGVKQRPSSTAQIPATKI
ncbi:unnamed protein product [Sphenostylis stenocarpa]|uniref:Microtubule-binding protein TANGLED n=1 Tax=Sphenostylis stenocarpa TaxID=92480 RepID=A0AA86VNA7_9FABA|nr:unnamed protein product [Sphenostylis stenocarpa]